MAELSKLTDRILAEADEKAKQIVSEANEKIDKINQNANSQAQSKFESLVEVGKREAESLKDRLRSNAHLKARDNELKAKQEVIQRVFEESLSELKNISPEKYLEYIKRNALLAEDSALVVTESMYPEVVKKFPDVDVLSDRYADTGFIEITGGVERNFTFSTQINYIREDIQGEIAGVLFK